MEAREIMTSEVTSARPSMGLGEAAELLIGRRLRAVPVIDEENHVLGLLTDRHLVTHFLPVIEDPDRGEEGAAPVEGQVRDIMERAVMCVNDDEPVVKVMRLMVDKEIERLPVVREGRLVGFLTRGDIIRRLIIPEIHGHPTEPETPTEPQTED